MFSKNNFITNGYYSRYDILNKFNLDSLYKLPKIDCIVLEFSLNKFISASENTGTEKDVEMQTKSFLLFYNYALCFPFVKSCKLKIQKSKSKEVEFNYILKVKFSKEVDFQNFLVSLFVESWPNIISSDLKLFSTKKIRLDSTFINFQMSIPASTVFDFESIVNNLQLNINSKEFFVNINFIVYSPIYVYDKHKLLKNLPLFWISG